MERVYIYITWLQIIYYLRCKKNIHIYVLFYYKIFIVNIKFSTKYFIDSNMSKKFWKTKMEELYTYQFANDKWLILESLKADKLFYSHVNDTGDGIHAMT